MKILTFAASLRKDSFNRKLIHQAVEVLRKTPEHQLDVADFREFEMPVYDGDAEDLTGIPPGALELIKRLNAADALIISTPEYNGSIPGGLKNAIDWASRADDNPFLGKPLLLLGTSPGAFGAVRGLWHTRVPFEALGTLVFPSMFGVSRAQQAFDPNGNFADPKNLSTLSDLIRNFLGFAKSVTAK